MVESYTEKMSDELIHLNKEDQAYVKKMVAYIGAKSYFYDDEALGEQLYNMVCDLKVAEKEGIRAVEYFGKDPRSMVDLSLIHIWLLTGKLLTAHHQREIAKARKKRLGMLKNQQN